MVGYCLRGNRGYAPPSKQEVATLAEGYVGSVGGTERTTERDCGHAVRVFGHYILDVLTRVHGRSGTLRDVPAEMTRTYVHIHNYMTLCMCGC